MYIKYFLIQYSKATFSFLKLHIIFGPFYNFFRNIAYLSAQSKWINQNRQLGFNDFFTTNRSREKRLGLYQYLLDSFVKEKTINYLEFGVANGGSFFWWLENHQNISSTFHGFDTFTGLPEDWGHFKKGDMNNGNELIKTNDKRANFYQGLFQQTLPVFLKTFENDKMNIIHIDADLYSSTLFTLTSLAPFLKKGDIIFFDEFCVPTHEFLAFKNFTESYYIQLKPVGASNNYLFTAFEVQ